MSIELTGLNRRQRLLADLIWNCETMEQAESLIRSLQGQDRKDAHVIMQCMIYEVLEERLDAAKEPAEAAISRARYS